MLFHILRPPLSVAKKPMFMVLTKKDQVVFKSVFIRPYPEAEKKDLGLFNQSQSIRL